MNGVAALLLAFTLVVAVADWIAVQAGVRVVEYVAKPATMVLLIATVVSLDGVDGFARACVVVALTFSLLGDVFLMLPDGERWFVAGLGSFLVGHLAYIPGLWAIGVSAAGLTAGLVVVAVALATLGRRIVAAGRSTDEALAVPVRAYIGVISAMVVSAAGTLVPVAMAGAALFYASDALIAWNRFVHERPWGRLAIMVTYHLGQIGLSLSLLAT